MTNELRLNVEKDGAIVTILQGQSAKIYDPRLVEIKGNIDAPAEFIRKRTDDIPANKTNVVFDMLNRTISLIVDEESHFAKHITGVLEYNPDLLDFGINKPTKRSVSDLYKMLRLKRAFFKKREDHATILDQLKKFEAKTEVEFKSTNDFKGSTALSKIQSCKTNLTYNFTLNLPIYIGLPDTDFNVEIEFEPTDGSIMCWLISEDLAELEVNQRDAIMEKQLSEFADYVVIIK